MLGCVLLMLCQAFDEVEMVLAVGTCRRIWLVSPNIQDYETCVFYCTAYQKYVCLLLFWSDGADDRVVVDFPSCFS